jgi:hypothetical protein
VLVVIMTAAVVSLVLLGALAVFQGLLVAGLPLGRFAWGGQNEVLPAGLRIGSAVSIVLYAGFAVLILHAAGALELLPGGFSGVAIWVLTAYFLLGIVMNAVSRSRPERLLMTPVVALLAVCCLALAVG